MDQEHPVFVELNAPVGGGKAQPGHQIGQVGKSHVVDFSLFSVQDGTVGAMRGVLLRVRRGVSERALGASATEGSLHVCLRFFYGLTAQMKAHAVPSRGG